MKKTFGEKLKTLRGATSQAQVAAVFGIAQQTYGGWETDKRKPDLTELCRICTHYSVSADWMLGLDENQKHPDRHLTELNCKIRSIKHDAADATVSVEKLLGSIKKLEGAL